ncbi:cytochrome b5-like heme/steroid binding domain-containing protein [Virgisporangium aliadipatigenens]|uniref:cytochrome b5-like heme/steroid binding domain-containing protein n=1 Tax=Virgisporangium aliadipatigenens TaxID=741659 RepID=UPI0019439598|nr:cytochrome b5-like heme/steroid binding domain-containing protein [Virgisporangium aliadipatigenens]
MTDPCSTLVTDHVEFDRRPLLDLLIRYSGLTRHTPRDRIAAAVADEVADLAARGLPTDALAERVNWLLSGTPPAQLNDLDPIRDCDRIHHALGSAFRVEARVAELLAILRIAQSSAVSLFFRSTREAEDRPVQRFHDTYTLFANYFEWGADSSRGRAVVARLNEIHGRYLIPQEGMKYVLLDSAFTWLEAIERIGHRPLLEVERLGYFHAYVRLGRDMNIADLTDDYAAMYRWFLDASTANDGFHPLKRDTFETIASNSLGDAGFPGLREAVLAAARVGMHPVFRRALGYPEPTPRERERVRGVFYTLGTLNELLPAGAFVRSLQNNPAHPGGPPEPSRLGVSDRSPHLPVLDRARPNGGHPHGLLPLHAPADAPRVELPELKWDEIAKHDGTESLWVVISGEVFDVTAWARHHPGGRDVLLRHAGRDATAAFAAAGHSAMVETFRLNYRVGRAVS